MAQNCSFLRCERLCTQKETKALQKRKLAAERWGAETSLHGDIFACQNKLLFIIPGTRHGRTYLHTAAHSFGIKYLDGCGGSIGGKHVLCGGVQARARPCLWTRGNLPLSSLF